MRVCFPRLADGTRSYSIVDRDDGVRYRVDEGIAGPEIPHDLVHLIVERETRDDGGFWGAVAAGAVFDSMTHVSGRRPPRVRQRSDAAIRARRDRLQRSELMAGLVSRVNRGRVRSADEIRRIARDELSTLPNSDVLPDRVLAAADALRAVAQRWAALPVGERLVVDWPAGPKSGGG